MNDRSGYCDSVELVHGRDAFRARSRVDWGAVA
jgi:hypothetical protein